MAGGRAATLEERRLLSAWGRLPGEVRVRGCVPGLALFKVLNLQPGRDTPRSHIISVSWIHDTHQLEVMIGWMIEYPKRVWWAGTIEQKSEYDITWKKIGNLAPVLKENPKPKLRVLAVGDLPYQQLMRGEGRVRILMDCRPSTSPLMCDACSDKEALS